MVQSLVGIGSGRLFGLGLGAGREKWGLLPNPHTDFIFSVIGEEIGSRRGAASYSPSSLCLGWLGLRAARNAPDRFAMLVAVGITLLDRESGGHQHRCRYRRAAGHGHPSSFRLVRRFLARDNPCGGGNPREHRLSAEASTKTASNLPDFSHEHAAIRTRRRRWDRRSHCSRAGGGPGARRQTGRPEDVELVGSARGLDSRLLSGVGIPVTLLGGRGFVRSVVASCDALPTFGLS